MLWPGRPHVLNHIHLFFSPVIGQAVEDVWPPRRLICHFITRNKRVQIRKSGVCWHGVAKKTKKKAFEDSLPISLIDWHGNQRRVLSPPFDFGGCKKLKLQIAPHTLCRLCAASAPPPRPRLSRDLNRSVCVCLNEQSPPILL